MQPAETSNLEHVTSILNYIDYTGERPAYYIYDPKSTKVGIPPRTTEHTVSIYDVRDILDGLSLDVHGFAVHRDASAVTEFLDDDHVREHYYPEVAALVEKHTGASRVHVFDHNVRNQEMSEQAGSGISEPVRFVHNDYTEKSGPQRVRDLFGDQQAEDLLKHRFVFINLWRPLRGPVQDMPLAVCDAQSIDSDDFIATDLKYPYRTGEVYSVRHNPAHRWFYVSGMQPDEFTLLKCYDSERDGRARYTAHSAFRHPQAPDNSLTRQSIEARTIAFFAAD